LLAYIILLDASTAPKLNKRDGDTIFKVAASQFGKKIEKYVDKTAEVYIQKE
jgi:hypothetical protein